MVEIIYIFIGKGNLNPEWFYDLIRMFPLLRATAKPQSQFFWLLLYRFFPLPRWCLWVWLSPSSFTDPGWWTEFAPGIWAQAEVQVPNSPCSFHLLLLQFNKAPPNTCPMSCLHWDYDSSQRQRTIREAALRRPDPCAHSWHGLLADFGVMMESSEWESSWGKDAKWKRSHTHTQQYVYPHCGFDLHPSSLVPSLEPFVVCNFTLQ